MAQPRICETKASNGSQEAKNPIEQSHWRFIWQQTQDAQQNANLPANW
jgi:hypothetical protein